MIDWGPMSTLRMAWLFAGLSLLMRLILYLGTAVFGTDSGQFLYMADWMSEGRFHDALMVTYHPLYPFLVAAAKPVFASTEQAGFWVSMILGSASVMPLFLLAHAVFGRPVAFLTAFLYAFHGFVVELHADVMSEAAFSFFFFWTAWLCWRVMEEPSLELGVLAGAAAACCYLTRPEGVLALVLAPLWLAATAIRRGDRPGPRWGGLAACAVTMTVVSLPFILWVHGATGSWKLSAKNSVRYAANAIQARIPHEQLAPVNVSINAPPRPESGGFAQLMWDLRYGLRMNRYGKLVRATGRMIFLAAPFWVIGIWRFSRFWPGWEKGLFYFSFPLGYMGGLVYAMRAVGHASMRYIVPSISMMSVVAAMGAIVFLRWLLRRMAEREATLAWRVAVILVSMGMTVRCFNVQRQEQSATREAAAWIRAQGVSEALVYTTVDKIGYLSGTWARSFPPDMNAFRHEVRNRPAHFCVYFDKDLIRGELPYLGEIGGVAGIGPAVSFPRTPRKGVWTVYVHPSR